MTKPSFRLAALAAASLLALPAVAGAWAPGGHSYIALHTHKKAGLTDANELCNRVFGAMEVDLFNYDFSETGMALQAILHGMDPATGVGNATAAEAWDVATGFGDVTPAELAFAYGFASHNDGWGTDYVAHWSSLTLDPSEGYVVQKARQLAALMPPLALLVIGEERLPLVSHVLVEYAADLVLADRQAGLGAAMMQAASCEEPAPPRVLVQTLAPHVAAIVGDALADDVIAAGDLATRQVAYGMGEALAQPTATERRDHVAALVALLAKGFLAPLPPELDDATLQALIAAILDAGKGVVAPDLMDELRATTGQVNGTMSALRIAP